MEASMLDLRRRMREVLKALDRNEKVTVRYRGRKKGTIIPAGAASEGQLSARSHPAFGIWKDRSDLREVGDAVREMRERPRHGV